MRPPEDGRPWRKTVGVTGFEPATTRSQSGCATKLRHTPYYPREGVVVRSERVTGIEPAPSAWKAEVLPLNYTRVPTTTVGSPRSRVHERLYPIGVSFRQSAPARVPASRGSRYWEAALPSRPPAEPNPAENLYAKCVTPCDAGRYARDAVVPGPRTRSRTQIVGTHHVATIFLPDGVSGKGAVACTRQGGPSA